MCLGHGYVNYEVGRFYLVKKYSLLIHAEIISGFLSKTTSKLCIR